ncbi:CPBP family intramembrane glutamic endopeptidase [Sphingomonas aracearum]|uniref:CPBP family intramembrane metalloprotease n=1 Tax=Sphingomonas aracearum TaxID=2283317 RepID=A0A369VR65_9SPHN|nr:CPBP family intramembrane glutamic endopeptidase [Sphingomonas aracearum]RDE04878.1 CPBP family intramembrane metalloprotease [Sphingomonas aracearum]
MLPAWLVAAALAAGTLFNAGWTWARARRGKPALELVPLASILPRWREELPAAAFLSLVAGVSEELFFRLVLPVLFALVGGGALAGFVVGTAAFALLHRYQGWRGMLATALVGIVLAVLYLASGQLWVAMAAHAAIDLNALVVRPLAGGRLRRGWTRQAAAAFPPASNQED